MLTLNLSHVFYLFLALDSFQYENLWGAENSRLMLRAPVGRTVQEDPY